MYLVRNHTDNYLVTKRMRLSEAKDSAIKYSRNRPTQIITILDERNLKIIIARYKNGMMVLEEDNTP